jgi:micrococcal nuclease
MDASALIVLAVCFSVAVFVICLSSGDSAQTAPPPDDTAGQFPTFPDGTVGELRKVNVQHVIDGDTVVVSVFCSEIRVRLYGIDCPEDGQPWGNIATAGLIKMIGGRTVHMETHGLDQYDRTLATIYVKRNHDSEWINVNERMVMLGHAWVMRKYYENLPIKRQNQLNRLERWARSKRVGLWKTDNPIPPWQWRQSRRPDSPKTYSDA